MTLNSGTVSIYGGQIYTVRWQLQNITTLIPGECVNILKSYYKVRYLVECLGHSAFILEFYIAFDIILICLTGTCFINKLKLSNPFKSYEIVPSIRLQWIFTHPLKSWINVYVFQMPDGNSFAKEIGLKCGFI